MNPIVYTNANKQDILIQNPKPATFALIGGALISLSDLRLCQNN